MRLRATILYKDVYAIGDVAAMVSEENPRGHPMLAPVAQQQGTQLAKNLVRSLRGESMRRFRYRDKGTMATVGRNRAVVDLPQFSFAGFFAWLTWMLVHVVLLVGFRQHVRGAERVGGELLHVRLADAADHPAVPGGGGGGYAAAGGGLG